MSSLTASGAGATVQERVALRARVLFEELQQANIRHTDRLFAGLLSFQWVVGLLLALWISPLTWAGSASQTHVHVWAAALLGGAIIALPLALVYFRPGELVTRHSIAVAQALSSALLIHLTGGRIETHFHIFGSLAFLAFYRDWRVLISFSAVVGADHLLRSLYYPESVFGVLTPASWRWLEHTGWVVFEDVFLISSCLKSTRETELVARRQAELEEAKVGVEIEVAERTRELRKREDQLRQEAWAKSGHAELLAALQAENDVAVLSLSALRSLVDHVGALVGALYVAEGERYLRCASYGLDDDSQLQRDFKAGQGILGEALRQPLTVQELPAGARLINLGLGQVELRSLVYAVCRSGDQSVGLVAFGFAETPSREVLDFLRQSAASLGLRLESAHTLRNLAQSEERFRCLMEHAGDPLFLHTREGRILEVNRSTCEILGRPREEVIGQLLGDFEVDSSQERTAALLPGEGLTTEGAYRRSDGSECLVEAHTTAFELGSEQFFLTLARDMTEHQLVQAELRGAIALAEEANRAKSEFLAVMSHEIRTPMNGIIGMTDLLQSTTLNERQHDYVNTIRASSDCLLNIINDILDLSKIEAGKLSLETVSFDMGRVVEDVTDLLSASINDKGLELIARYAPSTPRFFSGDPGRIRQVILNLVNNAIKFTEEGHIFVSVECLDHDDHRASLKVSVEDTGVGMPAETLERIFEKFSQADSSTTRRYGGTGLGLAICQQLVEAMGGAIKAESTVGEGSRFSFTLSLPLSQGAAESSSSFRLAKTELAGLRVLIVDDNPVNRTVLTEQAELWQLRATVVPSALKALAELRRAADDPYRLVILDYEMPEMDGGQLARLIRSDPSLSKLKLLMLSSIGQRDELEKAVQDCLDAYLVKPVHQARFLGALLEVMAEPADAPKPKPAKRSVVKPAGAAPQVLLVEDNFVNQKVATHMLKNLGAAVSVAGNGREAVDMVALRDFDLIFMDCHMPELDGYEAIREIRERGDDRRAIPIVALTASAMPEDRQRCLAAGMDGYITKPVSTDSFAEVLEMFIGAPRQKDTPPKSSSQPA